MEVTVTFTQHRVLQTEQIGPAGIPMFRVITEQNGQEVRPYQTCPNCFMCPTNGLLAFRPYAFDDTNFHGFVMPASQRVMVRARGESEPSFHLLPTPFCAMLLPFRHLNKHMQAFSGTPFARGVVDNWSSHQSHLLRLVPDLEMGQPYSMHEQYGREAGARPQGWEQNRDADDWQPHGFTRVTYGRERLREVSSETDRDRLTLMMAQSPITTATYGLDMILHLSRVAAGSLPADDQVLWDIWERYAGEIDDINRYHRGVLALAA